LVTIQRLLDNQKTTLREFPLSPPLRPGEEYKLELRAVGSKLTVKLNGATLGEVNDESLTKGPFGVCHRDPSKPEAKIKHLQFLDLDPPGGASVPAGRPGSGTAPTAAGTTPEGQGRAGARPSEATKEAPFVNGLGMQFVPVPITGGPTDGKRGSPEGTGQPLVPGAATSVLFSVWETRVQDYSVFAKETQRERPKAKFEQGPTHPAVNVTWDDAQAFCQWLTARERQAERLGATESYRLPSDHEWSRAAGIGEQEDATKLPGDKKGKIPNVYPWGAKFPPPNGSGNFSGEESIGFEATQWQKNLSGYRDPFPMTAPAASFAADRFGLYDLSGNVWEWCEDLKPGGTVAVVRSGAFSTHSASELLSSARMHEATRGRFPDHGFRVVLAPVP